MGAVVLSLILLAIVVAGFGFFIALSKRRRANQGELDALSGRVRKPAAQDEGGSGRGLFGRSSSTSSYVSDITIGEDSKRQISKIKASMGVLNIARWSSLAVAVIAAVCLVSMCFTQVSAKNVGVAVNFGAVSERTLSPGVQPKLPWTQVIEIDGTIQTDEYAGESCIPVRIGDGSQACADIVNRWFINPAKASGIYEQHRSNDPTMSFRAAIVSTQLKQAVQEALKNYNPIAELKAVGGDELASDLSFAPDYGEISRVIQEDMKSRLSERDQAQIDAITFSYLKLSDNTQRKLDDYVAAIGETRIATQQEETAKAQARANRELSASVSNDPNVLVSRCFDIVKDATQNGYQFPAGFNCWDGGGSALVIPGSSNNNG